jgi:hypothetical protein
MADKEVYCQILGANCDQNRKGDCANQLSGLKRLFRNQPCRLGLNNLTQDGKNAVKNGGVYDLFSFDKTIYLVVTKRNTNERTAKIESGVKTDLHETKMNNSTI